MKRKSEIVSLSIVAAEFLVAFLILYFGAVQPDTNHSSEKDTPAEKVKTVLLESTLAGRWYTADRKELEEEIAGYLANATGPILDNVQALILPHAGYQYSGQTAAFGIRQIEGKEFSRVIVLGPSHRVPMENYVSVPQVTHYRTPLGEVALDLEFISRIRRNRIVGNVPMAHEEEHSVQIEVPLLQQALGSFRLVPMVVGQLDDDAVRRLADLLSAEIDERSLVVASSDFTHFGPNYRYTPFFEDIEENLSNLDLGAVAEIEEKDVEGFREYCRTTGATICGQDGISVLLAMLSPDSKAHLLRYDTSGKMTGDMRNSVSYLSVAFTGKWPERKPVAEKEAKAELSEEDKKTLLQLARKTIAYALENRKVPEIEDLGIEITPAMKVVSGAFVTLKIDGNLRGCIGEIFPSRPLYKTVLSSAINAAFRDTRFRPLAEEELGKVEIEISALTPPHKIDSYEEIVIGRHGVVLAKNGQQAVFLPQVAPEQGWNLEQTLTHLSQKAGLGADDWREGAQFEVFEAIVFHEVEV